MCRKVVSEILFQTVICLGAGAPATFVAALYLGLGEQRHRPRLRLQRGGLPFSLRP